MFPRKKLIIIIFFIISFFNITKVYSIEADIFVQSTVNRAAKTLSGNFTKEERIEKLKEIAKDTVDIKGIGFYSLGKHRKNLSDEQLKKYEDIFKDYFLKSFSSRLAEYSNPEIEVNSKKKINEKYTIVSSTLIATETRPEVKIEWRVYTNDPENLLLALQNTLNNANIIVLCGQSSMNDRLNRFLVDFSDNTNVIVIVENTSNQFHNKFIHCIDRTLCLIPENQISNYIKILIDFYNACTIYNNHYLFYLLFFSILIYKYY